MKGSNKGGRPTAESLEGRPETKENVREPRMRPTQGGPRMSQGLEGVRRAAKERKQEKFTALLHHLTIDLVHPCRRHRGAYRAQPSRRVYILKSDGRQRPLGVAVLEDKIVQQAVTRIMWKSVSPILGSYA
jgi:hypothetical protein